MFHRPADEWIIIRNWFKYRTAGVREYWIVDPDKDRTFVYHFVAESAEEESMEEYTLKDSVKAGFMMN